MSVWPLRMWTSFSLLGHGDTLAGEAKMLDVNGSRSIKWWFITSNRDNKTNIFLTNNEANKLLRRGGSVNPQRPPEEKEAMRNDNILRTGKTARDASYNGINGSLFKGYLCLSRGLWLLQCLCNWCRACWCRIVDCGGCFFFAKFNIESFNIV